jgi:hypothetical protein
MIFSFDDGKNGGGVVYLERHIQGLFIRQSHRCCSLASSYQFQLPHTYYTIVA